MTHQTPDLPARLEAVLTERYTSLGNPFSRMRRQEKGPDGWPAERPVGPHHVAEALRELLADEQPAANQAALLPAWEAVYEPGNVSNYLIGYANDQDASTGMAEAWMRSQAEVTGRLEWVDDTQMATGRYDRWFELIERHDGGVDTGPGIIVRRRVADEPESAAVSAAVAPVLPSPKDTAAADESPHIYLTAIRHQAGHAHDFTKAGRMAEALEHVEAIERLLGVYRRAVGAALDQVRRLADETAAPEVPLPFTHTDDDSDQLEIGAAVASTYTGEAPVVYVAAEQLQAGMVATVYVRPERVDELVAALRAAQVAARALPVAEVSQDGVTA